MLKIEKLNSFYSNTQVLWDIDLDISQGEITCLLGRNGAGKTTLLKSIMGLVKHIGIINFQKKNIATLAAYKRPVLGIAYVPQGKRLFSELTVFENLRIGLNVNTVNKKQHTAILESVYQLFPILQKRLSQISATLSGGEQQLLAIARALCLQPKVLLLDEPSEGLMPRAIDDIHATLSTLQRRGVTVLLVEQRLDMVLKTANKIIFIENGKIKDQLLNEGQSITDDILHKYVGI